MPHPTNPNQGPTVQLLMQQYMELGRKIEEEMGRLPEQQKKEMTAHVNEFVKALDNKMSQEELQNTVTTFIKNCDKTIQDYSKSIPAIESKENKVIETLKSIARGVLEFIAGMAIGAIFSFVGLLAGASVGSLFGPVGASVGAAVGFVTGLLVAIDNAGTIAGPLVGAISFLKPAPKTTVPEEVKQAAKDVAVIKDNFKDLYKQMKNTAKITDENPEPAPLKMTK